MEHRRASAPAFGRRPRPQAASFPVRVALKPAEQDHRLPGPEGMAPSIEDEIKAWKSARRSLAGFPWRQLSLMAGLCFGIASFVLPASVNDAVQWPLYALAAAGFCAGFSKRKAKIG